MIRLFNDTDSVSELTALLHRSYARLANMGLDYLATHQSEEVTIARMAKGLCYVLKVEGDLIATIMYHGPAHIGHTPWLDRKDVSHFGQLAVDPQFQGRGIGKRLVGVAEAEAWREGACEIALDTAEPALHLVEWYKKLGYRFIEFAQWKETSYRSVIMSKAMELPT